MTEDEMVGWYSMDMSLSKLRELVKERGLACCSLQGRKESIGHDRATEVNWPTPALDYHRLGFNFQLYAFILNTTSKWDTESG